MKINVTNRHEQISFHDNLDFSLNNYSPQNNTEIHIKPEQFPNCTYHHQIKLNNMWFVNLTNKDIPNQVFELIQFGERFPLPIRHNINKVVLETIKDIESNIFLFDLSMKANVRNHAYKYFDNFIKYKIPM